MRYIYRIPKYEHISSYVYKLLGCSFSKYIDVRNLFFMYKILFSGDPVYLKERFVYNNSIRLKNLKLPLIRTSIMNNSFIVRTVRLWNGKVPYELKNKNLNPNAFKKKIIEIL